MSNEELEQLRAQLHKARRLAAEAPNVVLLEKCDRLQRDLGELRAAAVALCDYIDEVESTGRWRTGAIDDVVERAEKLRKTLIVQAVARG